MRRSGQLNRRTVVGLAAGSLLAGTVGPSSQGVRGQAGTPAPTRATPSSSAATPIATPAAGSVATPVATGERAGPSGALEVVRDQRPTYPGTPKQGGRFRIARATPTAPDDFNPVGLRPDAQVVAAYLDPLIRPDDVTMEPRPWLASSWTWSDGGTTLTLGLRDDVRWHDGTAFTAGDAAFSLLTYRDDPASAVGNAFATLAEVTAQGAATLVLRLTEADGNVLLNALSQPVFQRAQYEAFWNGRPDPSRSLSGFDWKAAAPIGTGPWRIASWDRRGVRLDRFGDYWGAPAYGDHLEFIWEGGVADTLAAWKAGDTDLLWPVRATDIARLGSRKGRLYAADAASVMFAAFNFAHPTSAIPDVFADVRVRRALSLAIDRERYADEVFDGFVRADAAGTVAQPWAHDDSILNPRHDPRRASQLLEAAGWVDLDGDGILDNPAGIPFIVKVILPSDAPAELPRLLARVKEDWLDVGVVLNIEALNGAALLEQITGERDFDLVAYAYDLDPGFTDFDLYGSAWDIRRNPRGWNPGGYANPAADAAIAAFLSAVELDAQRKALQELQRAVDDDLFGLWFGFPQDVILVGEGIDGFQPNKVWPLANTARLWRATDASR